MKPVALLLALCCLFNTAHGATVAPAAYALPNTEVRDIRAQALQRDYQLFVALPDSYREGSKRYPVVFVVDADYSFAVVRNIAQRLAKHAGLEEVIVVGLSYARGDSGVYSRRRDYTPTTPRKHDYRSDMPGRQPAFGEAAGYAKFISSVVFPVIASQYRANMGRKIFVGHSYGSLLGLQIMLTEPRTFEHYILGSPSLWYDAGIMFEREQAYASTHKDLPASVFFGIGGLERLPAGKKRSRSEENADMLADLKEFNQKLTAHKFPGLSTRLRVFDDEDHASVFPMVLTHGLRAYLKSSR
ncbi:alpha/beta hydrolase [Janthinobacterium sp. RB2R34]|uniref:alpha/beta hydrolase n=1 Tax=Janthinobacterium sp. RB2R34 TaxID=3424193 RepID=UPI003F265A12